MDSGMLVRAAYPQARVIASFQYCRLLLPEGRFFRDDPGTGADLARTRHAYHSAGGTSTKRPCADLRFVIPSGLLHARILPDFSTGDDHLRDTKCDITRHPPTGLTCFSAYSLDAYKFLAGSDPQYWHGCHRAKQMCTSLVFRA